MAPAVEISADKRRQAYAYYVHHPSVSLTDIAAFLGVSRTTFTRLRGSWGWLPRQVAIAEKSDDARGEEATQMETESASSSLREAALSLASLTRAHIAALVREQRTERARDHDKAARALASYAKTLTTAQALLEQEDSRFDDTGHTHETRRSIHELRDELALHLERIIAEEEARGGNGPLD